METLLHILETPKAQYLKALKDKGGSVGILGKGLSGRAVAAVLDRLGILHHSYDEKEAKLLSPEAIAATDLFVYSPGFSQDHPWLNALRAHNKLYVGEWNLGASLWQGPLIAITGTNGKTTLTEFLSTAFQAAGKDAVAVGNNGYPLCQALADGVSSEAIALCEISSFQAENISFLQADALLWTNISEDHLDRYGSLEAYFKAKWKLTQALKPGASFFTTSNVLDQAKAYGLNPPLKTCSASTLTNITTLPEAFNNLTQGPNYALARAFWQSTGLEQSYFDTVAKAFRPLKHRLQKVATKQGVEYWNDSKGTNFSATYAALQSFSKPVVWIGGGQSKGGDIASFCASIAPYIQAAFLIGETAPQLQSLLSSHEVCATIYPDLQSLMPAVQAHATPGAIVLLSPGFSSLDQFKSYAERGDVFERLVCALES